MNTQRALLIAGLSSIALATPAMAQDGSAFTGPRIEGIVGYDSVRPGSSTDIDNADDIDQSIDDVAYGVGVGYDFAVGGAVLGLEGEWIESEAKTDYDTTNLTDFGVSNIDAGRDLYIGVRAGVPVTPPRASSQARRMPSVPTKGASLPTGPDGAAARVRPIQSAVWRSIGCTVRRRPLFSKRMVPGPCYRPFGYAGQGAGAVPLGLFGTSCQRCRHR